jgi:hypothetical protein
MKRYITRHLLLAKLTVLALLTICFVQPAVGARVTTPGADPLPLPADDHRDGPRISNLPALGIVPGQMLRVTVAHVSGEAGEHQAPPDVSVGVWLLDSSGRVIAQSTQVQIPRNEFCSFNFNRAALNLPGEPGTGRLQVRAQLVTHGAEPYHFTGDPKATSLIVPSMEIVDNNTGKTRQIYNPYITVDFVESGTSRTTARCGSFTNNLQDLAPVGLAYGESLRISVLNPLPSAAPGEDGRKYKMLFAVLLFAADGRVIARSDEVTLDPGKLHSFDFSRAALPLTGEPGTGRVQTRAQVRYRPFQLLDRTRAIGSPISLELIDNSTGQTTAVWLTVGFFEVAP